MPLDQRSTDSGNGASPAVDSADPPRTGRAPRGGALPAPSTAVADVLSAVSRDTDARDVQLTGTADDVRQTLLANGAVALAPVGEAELTTYVQGSDQYSIHDGFVVASRCARETDAVITSDTVLQDATVPTVRE